MKFSPLTDLIQGSDKWHTWRKSGVGASNMSVIMGSLPFVYENVLQLWKAKTGVETRQFNVTDAMQEGIDTEPEARLALNKRIGVPLEPMCFTHPDYSFLRASLDGFYEENHPVTFDGEVYANLRRRIGGEIKCPQANSYKKAAKGKILDYYYTQVQQQIACADLDVNYYYVFRKGEKDLLFEVPRCQPYIDEIVRRGRIFWDCVENRTPALPWMFNIDMRGYSDPFTCEGMTYSLLT